MSSISVGIILTGHNEKEWNGSTYVNRWKSTANSAGGVSVQFTVKNLSGKSIKYLKFTLTPYNRVNDDVRSEISHQNSSVFSYTGPLNPNGKADLFWENAWYNTTIVGARIDKVEIEYMDGSKETIESYELTVDEKLGQTSPIVAFILLIVILAPIVLLLMWIFGFF